jgi:hypothetical protein
MTKSISLLANNWPLLFWLIHTLMLVLFLMLEAAGFRMPVGSSLFWFAWIAVWMTHGLALLLGRAREREYREGDSKGAETRFRRRMGLGIHTALYLAFGPAILLWWLVARQPGPQEPGEGQGLWIYPLWLLLLLAHSAYVVRRERRMNPATNTTKRKRMPTQRLTDDGELEAVVEEEEETVFEPEVKQHSQRHE